MIRDKITIYAPPHPEIKSYIDMVDFAKEHGIKNLETLNIFEFEKPDVEFAHKLREYADEKGIKIVCVSVGRSLVGDDYIECVEETKKYADIAVILGSPYLHHTIAFEFENPDKILPNKEKCIERGLYAARELYDYAKEHGILTVCEDQGYIFNGIEGYKYLIENAGREIGVIADFGNIRQVDGKIEEFIPEFSDKIVHVHLKDFGITKKDERDKLPDELYTVDKDYLGDYSFGDGDVNFEAGFSELKKIGYDGYYAIERTEKSKDDIDKYMKNIEYICKTAQLF